MSQFQGLATEPDTKRGLTLLQRACDLEREYNAEERERLKAKGRPAIVYPVPSCTELGWALLLGAGGGRGTRRGLALLREECDGHPSQACVYLALTSELGLGGEARDVDAALEQYKPLCTIRTYYEDLVAGRSDPKASLSDYTNEPLSCYRLAALMVQGRSIKGDIRVAAHLYAEGCLGSTDFISLSCAPAAALFIQYGLKYKHPPYGGLDLPARAIGGAPIRTDPEQMAKEACAEGSIEGCRVLRWIHGYLDDHILAFDLRRE